MNIMAAQVKVQKFGAILSAMVMPNIGVFIGWGVLTALFIPTGWIPNEYFAKMVSPILTYLIPCLIGYTAGYNVHGKRGGVIGAFATMGTVVGASVPMLVGGMLMGPVAAWILKKFDKAVDGRIKVGLEMMIDNFSLGLIGMAIAVIGYVAVAPVMTMLQNILAGGVNLMTEKGLIPLVSLFVQPAQILFLNNAINHGIMVPLGLQQAAIAGKSILFLVEANGANWVGLAAAFAVFGTGIAKKSAPGAVIIMFFGGIAEVCFPYCLMMPLTIIGPIIGNMFSLFILSAFGGGTVGPPSPGSVFAFYMMTPKDAMLVNTVAYFGSLIITFFVTGFIIKFHHQTKEDVTLPKINKPNFDKVELPVAEISSIKVTKSVNKIVFACDAGMGSSAMGVSILRKQLTKVGKTPSIEHVAVSQIPNDADVVITNVSLAERARSMTNNTILILTLSNFMDKKEYDRIIRDIYPEIATSTKNVINTVTVDMETTSKYPVFSENNIILNASFSNKRQAIEACGDIFVQGGYTNEQYKEDMIIRDEDSSVYMGEGVALPHGLETSKKNIKHAGICFIQVPEGVAFDGEIVYLLIGIAGSEDKHVGILGQISTILCETETIQKLRDAKTKQEVLRVLQLSL